MAETLTYNELSTLLDELGFVAKHSKEATVYRHRNGALLLVPEDAPDAFLTPAQRLNVRDTLVRYGFLTALQAETQLNRTRSAHTAA
ncbi:hypothetical protein [Armatimonas sp.]|uniref:hypothetical protein n=1 Tax=Armatimonas sp. TaxID=1872638 RepID=UPI00374DD9E1